jgi:2-(1,2-epoxy-1,2-dihydrophenyl)acetyl-CoA isomerase
MEEKAVRAERQDKTCTLTINRPKFMNALSIDVIRGLYEALDQIASDEQVRVVVLKGAGENFSAGGDMNILNEDLDSPGWLDWMNDVVRVTRTMRELPQPVVAKVRGVALGGGMNLALAADFVLASHDAKFGEFFVNVGAILEGGGTFFLPRLVGLARARELALLGEMIDGKRAEAIGLIYRSVPDEELDREAASLVETLLKKPPKALALIKEGIDASLNMSLREVLAWEASYQSIMLQTKEHKEAVKGFLKSRSKSR